MQSDRFGVGRHPAGSTAWKRLGKNRPKQKATNRNRKGPRCSRFTHDGGTRQQAAAARSHFTRERSLVRNQPRPSHKVPAKTTVSRRARGSGLGPPEGRTPAFWDAPSGHVAAGHLRASRGGTRDDMAGSQPGLAVWLFKLALRLEHWPKPNGRRKRPRRGRGEELRQTVFLRGQFAVGEDAVPEPRP